MDILKWKCISITFFCIKADRNALHGTDIIYGTDLIKIGKGNMPMLFINPYRSDGGWNLLDQCKPHFTVAGIGMIDKFFQSRTTKSSRIPGCHFISHPFPDRFSEKEEAVVPEVLFPKGGKDLRHTSEN